MCGISTLIAKKGNMNLELILKSLEQIQNRGYDSVGIGFFLENKLNYIKKLNIDNFNDIYIQNKNISSNIYIAHTRWATHGGISLNNTHPQISNSGKICLVHNGIIENYLQLKEMLIKNNFTFKSETDSEVIVNLIEYYFDKSNDIIGSIHKVTNVLQGTYGIALITTYSPDDIFLFKKGSPIVLSYNDNVIMASSEISGFNNLFNNYYEINNNQICILNKSINFKILNMDLIEIKDVYKSEIKQFNETLKTEKYEFWMEKEIFEQADSLKRSINNGARIYDNKVKLGGLDKIRKFINFTSDRHLLILGCGTSLHAGLLSLNYFKKYKCFNSYQSIDGSEFCYDDIPSSGQIFVIFCSQSGETYDLIKCFEILESNNRCIKIGIINVIDSSISKIVDCGVYLNCGKEVGVASTKSFTSMLMILKLVSLWFYQIFEFNLVNLNKEIDKIRKVINNIPNCLTNKNFNKFIEKLNKEHLFILGKNKMEFVAKEGALKIKETSYIHAEGYAGGSLKHGPFALLEKDTPVILLIDHKNKTKMLNTYQEIICRNSYCLIITNIKNLPFNDNVILLACEENYEEFEFSIILQMIALELSKIRNLNPDKPRNLAKVVTVE